MKKLQEYLDYLVTWLQEKVHAANCNGLIVGISGGIDSAVVALLAKKTFPTNYLTATMPCHSQKIYEEYANLFVKTHKLKKNNPFTKKIC
jgi:NAD+ synthase